MKICKKHQTFEEIGSSTACTESFTAQQNHEKIAMTSI